MNKIKLLAALMLLTLSLRAQNGLDSLQMMYDSLDVNNIPSGILWNRAPYIHGIHPDPAWYDGSVGARAAIKNEFYDLLALFNLAAYDDSIALRPPLFYSSEAAELDKPYDVPLAVMSYQYQQIDSTAIFDSIIGYDTTNHKYYELPGQYPYSNKNLFMGTALVNVAQLTNIGTNGMGTAINYSLDFKLPRQLYVSNRQADPIKIEIDFADGNGFVNVGFDQLKTVTYSYSVGTFSDNPYPDEILRVRMHYGQVGQYKEARIKLRVGVPAKNPDAVLNILNMDLQQTACVVEPEPGFYRTDAKVYVQYGQDSVYPTRIDKPILFIEGFDSGSDPYGNQSWTGFSTGYFASAINNDILPQLRLLPKLTDTLIELGYDVLIVDFESGVDDMRNNGASVIRLIQWVNEQMDMHGVDEQLVVTGASMGGIIARYALLRLEDEGCCHNTRLYATLDSPHNGANIPIGMQLFLRNMGYYLPVEKVRKVYENSLRSPAAKQLLSLHVNSTHNIPAHPTWPMRVVNRFATPELDNARAMHDAFYQKLDNMGGHPAHCRKLSIVNGSVTAQPGILNKGELIFDLGVDVLAPIAYPSVKQNWLVVGGQAYAVGSSNQHKLTRSKGALAAIASRILQTVNGATYALGWLARIATFTLSDPAFESRMQVLHAQNSSLDLSTEQGALYPFYDQAPGSSTNTMELVAEEFGSILPLPLVNAPKPSHTFVPSISALDIDTSNLKLDISIALAGNSSITPFDDIWFNLNGELSNNLRHVEITNEIIKWLAEQLENNRYPLNTPGQSALYKKLQTSFNYGKPEIKFIQQLNIDNGGRLMINNQFFGYHYGDSTNPKPNTHFSSYTNPSDCRGSWLKIKNGGLVELGDQATTHNTGEIVVKAGTFLEIFNGGELIVNDDSRVLIEEGAELIIHPGAIIELAGENAVLELQGKLTLKQGAVLAPSGNGILRFNQKYIFTLPNNYQDFEGNNVISLKGNGPSHTRLEILQNTVFPTGLDSLVLDSIQVKIADDKYINIHSPFHSHKATYTGLSGNPQAHKGISLFGQPHVNISHCNFTGGKYGMRAFLNGMGNPLSLQHCYFGDNESGLVVYGKKFELHHCDFYQNKWGLTASDIDGLSKIKDCDFTDQPPFSTGYGVSISGQAGGELHITGSLLENGFLGLVASDIILRSACTDYRQFSSIALHALNADLIMDQGADNHFDNNNSDIGLYNAGIVNLQNGGNRFTNTANDMIVGTIHSNYGPQYLNIASGQYELDVNGNYMPQSSGLVPVSLILNDGSSPPIYFTLKNWAPSLTIPTATSSCTPYSSGSSFGCSGCYVVVNTGGNGSSANEPVDQALARAVAKITWSASEDSTREDMQAIAILQGLFNSVNEAYVYEEGQGAGELIGAADRFMLDLAFGYYLTALSNAYRYGSLELNRAQEEGEVSAELQFILNEADLRLQYEVNSPSVAEPYLLRFSYELANAQAYRMGEHYIEALAQLNTSESWAEHPETEVVDYWECLCTAERDFILEEISEEEFTTTISGCVESVSYKTVEQLPYYPGVPVSELVNDNKESLQVELLPNPSRGKGTIRFTARHSDTRYQLSNAAGVVLQRGLIESGVSEYQLQMPYPAGVYLLNLSSGAQSQQLKWVITR